MRLVVVNMVIATLGAVLLIGAYRAMTTYLRHQQEGLGLFISPSLVSNVLEAIS